MRTSRVRFWFCVVLCGVGCDRPGDPTGMWYDGPWFASRVDGIALPATLDEPNGARRRYEKIELLILGDDNVFTYHAVLVNKTTGADLSATRCTAVVPRTQDRNSVTLHWRMNSECSASIVEGTRLVRDGKSVYMLLNGRRVETVRAKSAAM